MWDIRNLDLGELSLRLADLMRYPVVVRALGAGICSVLKSELELIFSVYLINSYKVIIVV